MEGEELGGVEAVTARDVRLKQVAEFVEIRRPAESVEEFHGLELEFVPGLLRDAGAEVEVLVACLGEVFDSPGHQDHSKIPRGLGEVVEGVVVIRDAGCIEVQQRGSEFASVRFLGEVEQVADDGAGEQAVEAFRVQDALAEAFVGVRQPAGAAFRGDGEVGLRDQFHPDA